MRDLIHRALLWRLVGTPAQYFRPVPKATAGEMIVSNFDNDFWVDWFPFAAAFRAPATRSAGCIAGKTRRFAQSFEFSRQLPAIARFEGRGETDMMKQTIASVETEEERSDDTSAGRITKSAYDTISAANLFHLHHRSAFA